jgi:hypothetical protein
MAWNLASAGRGVSVNLNASDNGALGGTITYKNRTYPVTGAWAAAGSIAGRTASAFSLAGRTQTTPDVPNFISASGIMMGPGNAPQSIEIRLGVSSSSDGSLIGETAVLLPAPAAAPNYAVSLAGAGGLVGPSLVGSANAMGTSDFTLETWIQPAGVGPIASFGNEDIHALGGIMALEISAGGVLSFSVSSVSNALATDTSEIASGPTAILDGEWHHVAAVRTGAGLSVYLDGEPLAAGNTLPVKPPVADLQPPYLFAVGTEFVGEDGELGGPTFLEANYDEMRLWKVALTPLQIADGMHHRLTDQESGLVGHWTFDQTLNDSSTAKQNLRAREGGTVSFLDSPIDFEPEGESYLVTQAQLMQDWVPDPAKPGAFKELSGYRVIISSRDANGNPTQADIDLWLASPQDQARLEFLDGSSADLSSSHRITRATTFSGELSFVIDSLGQLRCPPLKAHASFMGPGQSLVISPDRHVHATLAAITGPQLAGQRPMPSGKKVALNMKNKPTANQLDAMAQAVSHAMSAATGHDLQPERPQTRDASLPEDTPLQVPYVPRYQRLVSIVEPYHFASNAMTTHFLSADTSVTRILIPENMPNAHWMLNFSTGVFQPLPSAGAPPTGTVTYADPVAALFQGRTEVGLTAAAYLAALTSADAGVQKRWLGALWNAVKSAASVIVNTVVTIIVETGEAIKTAVVTAVDAVGNAVMGVLHTVEDGIDFVGALFAKVGAEIEDVVDFVKAVFDLQDIRRTADVIQSVLSQTPAVISEMLQAAQTKLDDAIASFQAYLDKQLDDDIKALGPASANGQGASVKSAPPSDIQSKYVGSLLSANAQQATDPSGAINIKPDPAFSSMWSSKFNDTTLQGLHASLANQPSFLNSPDSLLDAGLGAILSALKSAVDELLGLIRSAVDGLFAGADDVIQSVLAIAQARIDIPVLTDFYEQVIMGGQGEFSLLGVVSLMGAVGFNVTYKLVTGQTGHVFSDAQIQEIKTPGFLLNAYRAGPVHPALTGQPALADPSIVRTAAAGPDAFQIVQWAMGFTYAFSSLAWGVGSTLEDVKNIKQVAPDPPDTRIAGATILKMSGQILATLASLPIFTLPKGASSVTIGFTLGNWFSGILQFGSNYQAVIDPIYSFIWDPLVTGVVGVGQLGATIAYAVEGGDTGAWLADVYGAFEWIPQLGKYSSETKWIVPIVDAVAYLGVFIITVASTGADIHRQTSAHPASA